MKGKLKFQKEDGVVGVYNSKGDWLGTILYDEDWKKWVWEQESDVKMSWDCLLEVVNFIRDTQFGIYMGSHKENKK